MENILNWLGGFKFLIIITFYLNGHHIMKTKDGDVMKMSHVYLVTFILTQPGKNRYNNFFNDINVRHSKKPKIRH